MVFMLNLLEKKNFNFSLIHRLRSSYEVNTFVLYRDTDFKKLVDLLQFMLIIVLYFSQNAVISTVILYGNLVLI